MQTSSQKCISLVSFVLILCLVCPCNLAFALSTSDFNAMLQKAEQNRVAIAKMMETATVFIISKNNKDEIGMGTGFIIQNNYVLTNAHVVEGYHSYYIAGKTFAPIKATLIKKIHNKVDDFALLKFDQPSGLPILSFNLSLSRTDKVSAWGYPYLVTQFDQNMDKILEGKYQHLPPVVYTEGVVSAFVEAYGGQTIVHSANIAAGNSGGPLINSQGEVVGVNTWVGSIEGDEAFINGALPAHAAVRFLRSCGIEPTIADSGNSPILAMQESVPVRPFHADSGNTSQGNNTYGDASSINEITSFMNSLNGSRSGGTNSGNKPEFFGQIALSLLNEYALSSPVTTFQIDSNMPFGRIVAELGIPVTFSQSINSQNDITDYTPSTQAASQLTGQAKKLYSSALEGDAAAQAYIGASYYMGDEAPELEDEGVYWLQKSAAQNNPSGLSMLGSIYLTDPDYKNPKEGLELVRKATQEDAVFASILAYFLYRGEIYGVPRDVNEGFRAAQQSADINDMEGLGLLAYAYATGSGVAQNDKKAFELATKAVQEGDIFAHAVLSLLYCMSETIGKDLTKALKHAKIAADENDSMGLGLLALLHIIDGYPEIGLEKAREFAEESALQDDEVGQYVMGLLNSDVTYGTPDLPLAWAYLEMAIRKNFSYAIPVRDKISKLLTAEQRKQAEQYIQLWLQQWGL